MRPAIQCNATLASAIFFAELYCFFRNDGSTLQTVTTVPAQATGESAGAGEHHTELHKAAPRGTSDGRIWHARQNPQQQGRQTMHERPCNARRQPNPGATEPAMQQRCNMQRDALKVAHQMHMPLHEPDVDNPQPPP